MLKWCPYTQFSKNSSIKYYIYADNLPIRLFKVKLCTHQAYAQHCTGHREDLVSHCHSSSYMPCSLYAVEVPDAMMTVKTRIPLLPIQGLESWRTRFAESSLPFICHEWSNSNLENIFYSLYWLLTPWRLSLCQNLLFWYRSIISVSMSNAPSNISLLQLARIVQLNHQVQKDKDCQNRFCIQRRITCQESLVLECFVHSKLAILPLPAGLISPQVLPSSPSAKFNYRCCGNRASLSNSPLSR